MIKRKIIIAVTGASGSIYAKSIFEKLSIIENIDVHVIFSETGKQVYEYELNEKYDFPYTVYNNSDLFAAPASGSANFDTMIVIPCSMGTLARIANGISTSLIERAADVILKERKQLILVTREMPLGIIHIKNMESVTLAGGIIFPASPSFYSKPLSINEIIDTVINRVLNFVKITDLGYQWTGNTNE